jgi:2-dehydro-3-deoxygluconokinase
VAGARCVFVSGITAMLSATAEAYVHRLLETAADAGVPVLLDPNVRLKLAPAESWRDRVAALFPLVETVLVGARELALLGCDDPAELCTGRTRTVVVKRGSAGASAYTADAVVHQDIRPAAVVDPVGAGDAFDAGWISATLRGKSPEQSLREAAAVAAFVVATPTDTAGLPTAAERDSALLEDLDDVDR